jgi:cyclopropane-fatty-acyl-phospholipid synthase
MQSSPAVRAAGTSPPAIMRHYDLSDEFFQLWLGEDAVYSCALWDPARAGEDLATAQRRKLDYFADRLAVAGGRVLDVGCGWGGLLDHFVRQRHAAGGAGLTLSPAQAAFATGRQTPGVTYRLESWVDHRPITRYQAITAIESTEHLASDQLDPDQKVAVYRAFFERLADWLTEDGRVGLQLICLDGVGQRGSRAGRGPLSELIRRQIFPESMPASLSELVLGWETHFRLEEFLEHSDHYRRTFRSWAERYRSRRARAVELIGPENARTFEQYFAAGEVLFRLREHALYRVVLAKRAQPKRWAVTVWPSALAEPGSSRPEPDRSGHGASAAAIGHHYDVSNDFYRLWLGPSMLYSAGSWQPGDPADLELAQLRKLDSFAGKLIRQPGARVLDVGCGWGGNLRRLAERHSVAAGIGLTLSPAQHDYATGLSVPGVQIQLIGWEDHQPAEPYDAIVSYGAFEHFAVDGSTGPQRIERYRQFFARCYEWLPVGGGLGLETIGYDDAPDTDSPLGRGPVGDFVLGLFPESSCPHLSELVLGFEPWFEVELLEPAGADFARTFRCWQIRLRQAEAAAVELVGAETFRRFRRYLAASELMFRTRALTNYRLVLRRRPALKE